MWKWLMSCTLVGISAAVVVILWQQQVQVSAAAVDVVHKATQNTIQNESRESVSDVQMAPLQQRIDALEQRIVALSQPAAGAARTRDASPEGVQRDRDRHEPHELTEAEEIARTEATVDFLEAEFSREAVDPGWAQMAEQTLLADLDYRNELKDSEVSEMSCQSTLCRMTVVHASSDAELTFLNHLGELEAFRNGDAFSQRSVQGNGEVATVMFVSRSGHGLPVGRANYGG